MSSDKGKKEAISVVPISAPTTTPGYINTNGQVVIRNTGKPGADHLQKIYQLGCSNCGFVYGVNGADIFERKCPACQSGEPGLPL